LRAFSNTAARSANGISSRIMHPFIVGGRPESQIPHGRVKLAG
jgi:hypothetical protein